MKCVNFSNNNQSSYGTLNVRNGMIHVLLQAGANAVKNSNKLHKNYADYNKKMHVN